MIGESKNSDAGSFSVDPAELRNSARVLRETIDTFSTQPTLKFWMEPSEVGNEALAKELSEFQGNARDAVGLLSTDALNLAERLADSATGYEAVDSYLMEQLSKVIDRQ